jgi:hypothetical protein
MSSENPLCAELWANDFSLVYTLTQTMSKWAWAGDPDQEISQPVKIGTELFNRKSGFGESHGESNLAGQAARYYAPLSMMKTMNVAVFLGVMKFLKISGRFLQYCYNKMSMLESRDRAYTYTLAGTELNIYRDYKTKT